MACLLTNNITKDNCKYQVAGAKAIYLINFLPPLPEGTETNDANHIKYTFDANGLITAMELPENVNAYKVEFNEATASWTDDLAVNGSGGKYRTHTANFTIGEYDYRIINQSDALSLGRFIVVIVDKSDRVVCLGRRNGLAATSFNYASGAADADTSGWVVVLAGTEMETGQLLENELVISSHVYAPPAAPGDTESANMQITP